MTKIVLFQWRRQSEVTSIPTHGVIWATQGDTWATRGGVWATKEAIWATSGVIWATQGTLVQNYCISRFEQRDKISFLIEIVAPWP